MLQKILIADAAEGFKDRLQTMLSAKYQVVCADDGCQAWDMLVRFQPDLLVLDVELPEIDGITLLRQMYVAGYNPAVLVVSRTLTDYAVDTLIGMEIGYIMRKPCDVKHAAQRAEDILLYHSEKGKQLQTCIADILDELGIPLHLSGAKYLISAVMEMEKNPHQFMTKELYPAVGKRFGTIGTRVERNIRSAVEAGWHKGRADVWRVHFGEDPEGLPHCPNNTEIITHLVQIIKKL